MVALLNPRIFVHAGQTELQIVNSLCICDEVKDDLMMFFSR